MDGRKKVLVTGASGLLGGNVARDLYRKGYDIRLLVRPTADLKALADIPSELFHGDIGDAAAVDQAVKGCDYVVHAASVTSPWGVRYREYETVNIKGTEHVAEACLKHGVRRLVYVGTANSIGPGTRYKPGNELNAFSLHYVNSGYINSKYIAQQYILEQVERRGLPAVILNPTFMLGAYDSKPSSGQMLLYGWKKKILFYPPGGKNFVHVDDVCAAVSQALTRGKVGSFYLVAGKNLSYADFFRLLNGVTGQKNLRIRIPAPLLKTAGVFGSLFATVTGRPVRLTYASARLLCLYNYYSGRKAERELDIRYTSTAKAISQALDWFRENRYI